jgi:hypothetical protein
MFAAPVCLLTPAVASADATLDRLYQFGDDSFESPSDEGTPFNTFFLPETVDSIGVGASGFHDMGFTGSPSYENTGPAPTGTIAPVPGAPVASAWSMEFDGVDDVLFRLGGGLGSPAAVDNDAVYGGTVNYTGITTRLIDAWVFPTDAASTTRQDIIIDTYQFGIYITADNKWGHIYGETGAPVTGLARPSEDAVEYNQWTHVMQRTFTDTAAALYVNGVVVHATEDNYDNTPDTPAPPGVHPDIIVGAGNDRASNFFQGRVDHVSLSVSGNNSTTAAGGGLPAGQNWGDVDLRVDNDWIRNELIGINIGDVDVSGGDPDPTDIAVFKANWLHEQEFNGRQIGDWNSRVLGDLDIDGDIDLNDALILRNGFLAAGAGAVFDAAFANLPVPEPTSALLAVCGALAAAGIRRRR